jgi:hypothetical protein
MQARFVAGDVEGGFKYLEAAMADKDQRLTHMPCMPGLDEVRDMPRLKAIQAKVGALPP